MAKGNVKEREGDSRREITMEGEAEGDSNKGGERRREWR